MEQRLALEAVGKKILESVRTQVYLAMPFMGQALGAFAFEMDLTTTRVGTDAAALRFNPKYLMRMYVEDPIGLNRTYVHMVLHCLLGHPFDLERHPDTDLWNLCCDIAAESVLDTMEYPCFHTLVHDRRLEIYEKLRETAGVLTAPRLYSALSRQERDYVWEERLALEFGRDDHSFWERLLDREREDDRRPNPQNPSDKGSSGDGREKDRKKDGAAPSLPEDWRRRAKSIEAVIGKDPGSEVGELGRVLSAVALQRRDYRDYLRRFMVYREEARIDPDSFDYGFYNYGMSLYGNMPLIEENEFSLNRRVEELVIVIDSSASTKGAMVQRFLEETAAMLLTEESFFRRVAIHLVECDDVVQNDTVITDAARIREIARHFVLKGGLGTDYRPAFSYVAKLRREGKLAGPKGLLYFTDGFGVYPKDPPDYSVGFVFPRDGLINDMDTPDWAMRLYI